MPVFRVAIERTWLQRTDVEVAAENETDAKKIAQDIYVKHRGSLHWSPREVLGIEYNVSPWEADEDGADVVKGEEVWF